MTRPYWSGQIQISLVSFGVKLYVATEAKSEYHFHQIDRRTGERVRHQNVLSSTIESAPDEAAEPVAKSQILKGYEYARGRYVTFKPEEIEHLRVPSKQVMEITQFVDEDEIPPEYFEKPYFVVPESDAQGEAFATVRKALLDTKKIALSKIAFGGREHVVAIAPAGTDAHGGMMAYTMRYATELRDPADYFREIKQQKVTADSLLLAKELIQRKTATFDPEQFVDGYEAALKELVEAKLKHKPLPQEETPTRQKAKVINLMDALKRSVATGKASRQKRPALKLIKGGKQTATKSTKRRTA